MTTTNFQIIIQKVTNINPIKMKKIKLFFLATLIMASYTLTAQVAVTTDGSDPDGSAMLDVKSTEKGFLPPRMTEAQRNAIGSPTAGLVVWCTNCGSDGELQVYNGSEWTNMIGGAASVYTPAIGDYYQGGVIFYLDGSGGGLICAITDQDGGSGIQWWNGSYTTTGATATAIGTGQANTTAIIASQGAGSYAATVCTALGTGWFLPSKDELNAKYANKATIDATATTNGGTAFVSTYYWSSSESNTNYAWKQNFNNGYQSTSSENTAGRVRAVRAF
jgi:hypothetical protein